MAYMDESPAPGPSFVCLHANKGSRPSQFDWSKGIVLIGQNRAALVGQSCAAPIGWKASVLILEI